MLIQANEKFMSRKSMDHIATLDWAHIKIIYILLYYLIRNLELHCGYLRKCMCWLIQEQTELTWLVSLPGNQSEYPNTYMKSTVPLSSSSKLLELDKDWVIHHRPWIKDHLFLLRFCSSHHLTPTANSCL